MVVVDQFEESFHGQGYDYGRAMEYSSYMQSSWAQVAETTMPLKASKLAAANGGQFQASIEVRARQISTQAIVVNLISLLVNLLLAIIAFYFSFANNSTSTTAFAADCVLDFISSAIILWRYYGDVSSVCMHAREQIACIYLGALFEISALAIIIKAISDISGEPDPSYGTESLGSNELVYLAVAATIACSVLTVFKCALYKTLRDNSILLDVINTLISTVFAMSIVMSQAMINVDASFWYLDPILSILLAVFMMAFGLKVLHQNVNILKPVQRSNNISRSGIFSDKSYPNLENSGLKKEDKLLGSIENYGANNLNSSSDHSGGAHNNWLKADYSSITFS